MYIFTYMDELFITVI